MGPDAAASLGGWRPRVAKVGSGKRTSDGPPPHPLADLLPLLHGEEFDALVKDLRAHGLRQKITLFGEPPQVLDGRNRLRACREADVEPRFEEFAGTEEEAIAFVLSMNLARRHLSTCQRAALALKFLDVERELARKRMHQGRPSSKPTQTLAEVTAATGEATDRAGARVGVSKETVRQASIIQEHAPEVLAAMQDGTAKTMGEAAKLARLPQKVRAVALKKMREEGARLKDVTTGPSAYWERPGISFEWGTPEEILHCARQAMGGPISLDPASAPHFQVNVKASRFYTAEDDGLSRPWRAARLWLNPPFGSDGDGSSRVGKWVAKLLEEHEAGHVKQAALLVRAATNAMWFQPLWQFPLCFCQGRPPYIPGPGVPRDAPSIPTVLVGLGVDPAAFTEAFKEFGQVVVPDGKGIGRGL